MKVTKSAEFRETILKFSKQNKVSLMEAILHHCEKHGLEVETAAKLLNNPLKKKLKREAKKLHLLKKR